MMELDDTAGALLGKLDELGIADNTIVLFSTDRFFSLLFYWSC